MNWVAFGSVPDNVLRLQEAKSSYNVVAMWFELLEFINLPGPSLTYKGRSVSVPPCDEVEGIISTILDYCRNDGVKLKTSKYTPCLQKILKTGISNSMLRIEACASVQRIHDDKYMDLMITQIEIETVSELSQQYLEQAILKALQKMSQNAWETLEKCSGLIFDKDSDRFSLKFDRKVADVESELFSIWKGDLPVEYLHDLCGAIRNHSPVTQVIEDHKLETFISVVKEQQPFSILDNQVSFSESSWVDKLFCIANDSKHFRLTPHFAKLELKDVKGLIMQRPCIIAIDYSETIPSLYPWSLYEILESIHSPGDRVRISKLAYEFMRDKDLKIFSKHYYEPAKNSYYYPILDDISEE
ncbi:MAG: hypothetical protein Q8L98_06015, partial [Chlamydiales bacterium]|nr:hypothetical protein [Chlamydiales bacterium]